jgi:hypothetical protein
VTVSISCPECGSIFEPPKAKKRSRPQECRLHALARAAFDQWPENNSFRPKSAENLRYHITVEAGFFDVLKQHRLPQWSDASDLTAILTAILRTSADDNQFVDIDCDLVTIRRAKSTATMDHREYNALSMAFDEVLIAAGLHPDRLLRERAA